MFKNLKDKLKGAFNRFAKEVDESADVAEGEHETEQDRKELADEERQLEEEKKKLAKEKESDAVIEGSEEDSESEENDIPIEQEKKGFFKRVFGKSKVESEGAEEESAEKADTIDDIENSDEVSIKEEELDMPEDIPDEANKVDLQYFQNTIQDRISKIKDKSKEIVGKKEKEDPVETAKKQADEEEKKEKVGFIQKLSDSLTKKVLSEKAFNELFWELEITLLENNVAVEVIEIIKENLAKDLVDKPIPRKDISSRIEKSLKSTVEKILDVEKLNFLSDIPLKKPYKILVVGVNGSGKTTTIAKLVRLLQKNKFTSVLAASDTFRAAAIDQLQEHADNLNTKLIRHDYNSDPAAVAFDAIKYAEAKKLDTVVIDTAGRLHSNSNLMDELKKVYRVSKPDITIFVGESITGNDCVEQAKEFQKAVDFDAIILSKADVDEKGGAAISVSHITQRPILYLGVGQEYDDLEEFDKYKVMYRIFGDD